VHEVHAGAALDAALAKVIDSILQCAPDAVAQTKRLVAMARLTPPADLVAEAARCFRAPAGAEGIEGTAAFLQRRKPNWASQ